MPKIAVSLSMARFRERLGVLLANTALLFVGFGVAAVACEGLVRLLAPQDLDFYNYSKVKRPSRRPGQSYEYIPGSSTSNYIGVPVAINSLGLRGREVSIPKPAGTLRVLGIGDSVTFGYGVHTEETYLTLLEDHLNRKGAPLRYEVLNAGVEATGLPYYYHFLRERAARLEPDVILLGVTLNDISQRQDLAAGDKATNPRSESLVRRINQWLLTSSHLYLKAYLGIKSLLFRTGILDINHNDNFDAVLVAGSLQAREQAWRTSLDALSQIRLLAEGQHWPLILVIHPMETQLSADVAQLYERRLGLKTNRELQDGDPQSRIASFAGKHRLEIVDLLPAFQAAPGPLYLRNQSLSLDPVHFSPLGHDVAARAILPALSRTLMRPSAMQLPHLDN